MTSITPEEMKQIEKDTGEKMAFASPNPFNPSTNITFLLPEAADVKLKIYNVLGKRVSTLYNQPLQAGVHSARWNAKDDFGADVGSGHYFYVLSIGGQENTMTMKGKLLYLK